MGVKVSRGSILNSKCSSNQYPVFPLRDGRRANRSAFPVPGCRIARVVLAAEY